MSAQEEKPLTFKQFVDFYSKTIAPRFERIEKKLQEHDQRFEIINQKLDDFKKFEDLH